MAKKTDAPVRYQYAGFVDGGDDVWGVVIPDILGCVGGGATVEEAIDDATGALATVVAMMQADGQEIPTPRDMVTATEAYKADGGEWDFVVRIPLLINEGRSVRFNLSTDARTLKTIDQEAELRGLTRSAFMVDATLERIKEQR